jgi:ubiquinone/menaquinone biosynthesis C-methylase UbiE
MVLEIARTFRLICQRSKRRKILSCKSGIDLRLSRVTRSKREAKATYDRISGIYDLLEGIWEKKSKDAGLNKLEIKGGEKILEIGFGTGQCLMALAQLVGECGKVYGIDISSRMLEVTRTRIRGKGLSERVELTLGDAVQLPFKAGFFDAIFMSFTLELFDTQEIPKVLCECKRVLRSGGRICIVSLSKEGKSNWMRGLYEWGHKNFPRLLDCRPIFVQNALDTSGFQILDATKTTMWGLPVEIVLAIK